MRVKFPFLSMLLIILSFIFGSMFSGCTLTDSQSNDSGTISRILINQNGYYTQGPKRALLVSAPEAAFVIENTDSGEQVYSGTATKAKTWKASGEALSTADFSDLHTQGTFRLILENGMSSYDFTISSDLYKEPAETLLKSFYYQRAGIPIKEEYGGNWHWPAGHTQDEEAMLHESTGDSGPWSSPGGWYDAGDYGKYIVNGGITVGSILAFYELFPEFIGDDLNIPESGNNHSDLLDEVKYELEWMLTMQDTDGGVFFKLSGLRWPGMIMPASDKQQRYIIGKSTTSTLNFAACMAMAARIYEPVDSIFAEGCLDAAVKAWNWAVSHPSKSHPDTGISGSGPYNDNRYTDEFLWAAGELFISDGREEYRQWLIDHSASIQINSEAFWADVGNIGVSSLLVHDAEPGAGILSAAKASLLNTADDFVGKINSSPARIPMNENSFSWGSHGVMGNKGMILAYAHHFTNDEQYKNALIDIGDYLLGRNSTGYTCATGLGDNPPMHPHHRPSEADGIIDPVPGLVVGGPNPARQDNQLYPHTEPARSYVDITESYSSNEPAINQNASVFFSFAYLGAASDE